MPNLQLLMGRFTIKIHLKDNDVEKVVRTVVLQKREDKKPDIKQLIARNEGEITRQLKATKLATQSEDDLAYLPDYPSASGPPPFLGASAALGGLHRNCCPDAHPTPSRS